MHVFITNIKKYIRDMKIRQRMMAVFFLGCFLPLAVVFVIMFNIQNNNLIESQISNDVSELQRSKDTIEASMEMVMQLSEHFYFDDKAQKLGLSRYGSDVPILVGYNDFDEVNEYVDNYYPEVYSICVYVDEGAMEKFDNKYFRLITDTIRQKDWYRRTVRVPSIPSWSYHIKVDTGQRCLRLTKVLYNLEGDFQGILSISLKPDVSESLFKKHTGYAIMTLNDSELVNYNFNITENQLELLIKSSEEGKNNPVIYVEENECTVTWAEVRPRYSMDKYTIYLIHSKNEITKTTKGTVIASLSPIIISAIIMFVSLLLLSKWFTARIHTLNYAINRAVKDMDTVKADKEMGRARDEIWDAYENIEQMIYDMRDLDRKALDEQIQKEQLYSRQKEIEFKMLSAQINPHFLYNTLETIRMLSIINKQKDIEEISVKLTKLLRNSLEAGSELRTLAWEMDNIESYISIQNFRFGERIVAKATYDKEETKKYYILPFLVQPFVENAYVHAMEEMAEGGQIDINVFIGNDILLTVEDNGHGMTEKELYNLNNYLNDFDNIDRTHIGVANVNQRIKLRFGDYYGVKINSAVGEGTKVTIRLPKIEVP